MQYRTAKNGNSISALGFGCMRLPQKDKELCQKLIDDAIAGGVNYFDTAYLYSGNEALMGELLGGGRREKINLATKLPPFFCNSKKDFDKLFYTQLKRLQTDRIDYYLIHSLFDLHGFERLAAMGLREWIAEKKASGEILNIGFSYHGGQKDFLRLIDAYDWDFAQIQYNYLDENNQASVAGLDYAMKKGVPIVVMEPLRGGKLTNRLPEEAASLLKENNINPAEIGLRWVWNHPGVTCVLSGMNLSEQLNQNLSFAEAALPGSLTEAESEIVEKIKSVFRSYSVIPCTGCGYCMPCPAGVSIPSCFAARNDFEFAKKKGVHLFKMNPARGQYSQATGMIGKSPATASKCKKCGQCEKHCPQGIKIREELEEVKKTMEPWWFSFAMSVARKVNGRK